MISRRKPNNVFILNDSSCCEVTVLGDEPDDHHTQYVNKVCRRVEIYLPDPCDSRLTGGYKSQLRNVYRKQYLKEDPS